MFCELYPTDYPEQSSLNRILGNPIGISREQWPRFEGQPMQHLMTLDLATVSSDTTDSNNYRAVAIFIASLIDNDANIPGSGETQVLWISQNEIDRYGEVDPPEDWAKEVVESGSATFDVEDEVDTVEAVGDNYVGNIPIWDEYIDEPTHLPNGAFVMRLSSLDFPFVRFDAYLYVFEDDAFWLPHEGSSVPPAWRDLTQTVFQLDILRQQLPDPERLDRYGGLPPCGHMFEWPKNDGEHPLVHVMTLDASKFTCVNLEGGLESLDESILAVSLFYDPNWRGKWGRHTPYSLNCLSERDLNLEHPLQPPDGITVLPEARINFQLCNTNQTRTALSQLSLISPRPAWRVLDSTPLLESFILQIKSEHLPESPEEGTLYLYEWYEARWQGISDVPRQSGSWDDEDEIYIFTEPFGESMNVQQLDTQRDQIRILISGDGTAGYFGGVPDGVEPEQWPTYQGDPMTHVITLYTNTIPGLNNRPYAGVAIFLSSAWQHQAFFPDSEHAAVVLLNQADIASQHRKAPPDAEILPKRLLQAQAVPTNVSVDELSTKSFCGGGPIWLQEPNGDAAGFVMQLNDDVIDINLADSGTLYVYEHSAWIQSL